MSKKENDDFSIPLDDDDEIFSQIMSSQIDVEDQVSSLKDILESDQDVASKSTEIQKFLSSSNVKKSPIDIIDEKIFKVALTAARDIYFKVFNDIEDELKNKKNIDNVLNWLKVLTELLKCWNLCIEHVKTLGKVSVSDVKSFPESLLEIASSALNHCRNSKNLYGESMQSVAGNLSAFFRQCISVLNSFFSLLDTVITFNVNEDSEMTILLKIIDEAGKTAANTHAMDIKTSTDMWKIFGKLISVYKNQVQNISPHTATLHFQGLSENICATLSSISEKNQKSVNERSVICCRVLLKILEKLSDTYCDFIKKEVASSYVEMLIKLHSTSGTCLSTAGYSAEFVKFVDSNLTFMIESFLDVIFKSESFKIAFFDVSKCLTEDYVGFQLLLITVMKKISKSEPGLLNEWFNEEGSILNLVFANIDKIRKEICLGKIKVELLNDPSQGSLMTDIYECTLLNLMAMTCQISSKQFPQFELLLLDNLLSGNFFASMLSSDVWCFICRIGSSELCYSHMQYLLQVNKLLSERQTCRNVQMLDNLIGRLYKILSDKDKNDFINKINRDKDLEYWIPVARVMGAHRKEQLRQILETKKINSQLSSLLKQIEESPSQQNMKLLLKNLRILSATETPQDEVSCKVFVEIWEKLASIVKYCDDDCLLVFEELAVTVIRATHSEHLSKEHTSILKFMISLFPYVSGKVRIEICRFYTIYGPHFQDEHVSQLATLYCLAIDENDPWIQQYALESFENFTNVCRRDGLVTAVAGTIKKQQNRAAKLLTNYLGEEICHSLVGFENSASYIDAISNEKEHICHKRTEREEKIQKVDENNEIQQSKSLGSKYDIEKKVKDICSSVEEVMLYKNDMKNETYQMLLNAFQKHFRSN